MPGAVTCERESLTLLDAQQVTRDAVEMYLVRSLYEPGSPLFEVTGGLNQEERIRFLVNSIAPEFIHLFEAAFQADGVALTDEVLIWARQRSEFVDRSRA